MILQNLASIRTMMCFRVLSYSQVCANTINLMQCANKDAVQVVSQTLSIFFGLLCMAPASLLPASATFLSTHQLSHHSHYPPAAPSMTTTSPLDDPLSRSLTFSLRLIPLTMHVPKTDLIFFRGATPTYPPDPTPSHPLRLSCTSLLTKSKPCPQFLPKPPSHLPIAPPRAPPMPPIMSSQAGICGRVSPDCPPIPSPSLV